MATLTHPLSDIPLLDEHLPRLKALGYTTYEQLVSAAQAAGPELASYLGLASLNLLFNQIALPPLAMSDEVRKRLDALSCALGVVLDRVPPTYHCA